MTANKGQSFYFFLISFFVVKMTEKCITAGDSVGGFSLDQCVTGKIPTWGII